MKIIENIVSFIRAFPIINPKQTPFCYKKKGNIEDMFFVKRGFREELTKKTKPFSEHIQIDSYTYGALAKFHVWNEKLIIGKFCSIAADVTFLLGGEHNVNCISTYPFSLIRDFPCERETTKRENIVIGNDVWIGTGAIILSGVTIGDGCIIGAGAIVTKDIPPYAVACGNPAKVIKYRFSQNEIDSLLEIKWWNLPENLIYNLAQYLSQNNIKKFIEKVNEINTIENQYTCK